MNIKIGNNATVDKTVLWIFFNKLVQAVLKKRSAPFETILPF